MNEENDTAWLVIKAMAGEDCESYCDDPDPHDCMPKKARTLMIERNAATAVARVEERDRVFATVEDLVGTFLYYGRKEDDDLPVGVIEKMVASGVVTKEEIVQKFSDSLGDMDPE